MSICGMDCCALLTKAKEKIPCQKKIFSPPPSVPGRPCCSNLVSATVQEDSADFVVLEAATSILTCGEINPLDPTKFTCKKYLEVISFQLLPTQCAEIYQNGS